MTAAEPRLPRLRQAVIAATDLEAAAGRLSSELGLRSPFADEGVGAFGLRNAVFALGDTFLEVVSPVQDGTSAGRLLERRGGDCGYMLMFQVASLERPRARAREAGVREVFAVELGDMAEVHLHPADMHGAIVSLSAPHPAGSWRWGGSGWPDRSAPLSLVGARVAVADPEAVLARWGSIMGELPEGVEIVEDAEERGVVEILLAGASARPPIELGRVTVSVSTREEEA